jgi:four helix bundle protein
MPHQDRSQEIRDRTFRFACDVARLALSLSTRPGVRCIVDQLLKAGTSIGANLEEAKAGSSRKDFVNRAEISLREARETVYWLRICLELQLAPRPQLEMLRGEGDQIARILATIVINTKLRMAAGHAVFAFCILNFELLAS